MRLRRAAWRLGLWSLVATAALGTGAGAVALWWFCRPQPGDLTETVMPGVVYERRCLQRPRPLVVHVLKVDLGQPGVRVVATPSTPTEGHSQKARTTSEFLQEFCVQVAINASFFEPWHAHGPLDYYPHAGNGCSPTGLTVAGGQPYAPPRDGYSVFWVDGAGRPGIGQPGGPVATAVSCTPQIVREGQALPNLTQIQGDRLHPRTAIGYDRSRRTLILVVVDGRQGGYSEGVTLGELANLMVEAGAWDAMNLDGGGSSTMVVEGAAGRPRILNRPIHGRVPPGVERPVAVHLGVYVPG